MCQYQEPTRFRTVSEVFHPPRRQLVLHEIEIRRLVVADGVDLFCFYFSLQPSAFGMAPSVTDSPMRDFWLLS
jgi:hypothetical protein